MGKATDLEIFKRLVREARPFWPHMGGIFLLDLLATPLALLSPLPLKIVVDNIIGDVPITGFVRLIAPASGEAGTSLLVFCVLFLFGIGMLNQVQNVGASLLRSYTGEKLLLTFRARIFRHCQRLSLAYHDLQGTADSVYRIQYDANAIQLMTINGILPLVSAIVSLFGMIYVTSLIDLRLALIALTICPFLFYLTSAYRKPLKKRWKDVKRLQSTTMSVIQEVLTSLRVVKVFTQEDREQHRFENRSDDSLSAYVRLLVFESSFNFLTALVIAGGTGLVLFFGTQSVQQGTISLGDLLVVMAYLSMLYTPLKTLGRKIASLQNAFTSAERVYELLDRQDDVPEKQNARPIREAKGVVDVRDVSFQYRSDQQILKNVGFRIEAGQRVGIVGKTGAGKTTLISLLTRLYDPSSGRILLDDVDLRDYKLKDLRQQFGIVLQEPLLFSTSIRENIAYARPEASDQEIIDAATAANIHDKIESLPDSYLTPVGERGMRLSGGERQRVSLARAFLRDASILILDEPTSSVDTKTETLIVEAMDRLMKGRTAFIIAHRLSTLESCDVLLEVKDGYINKLDRSDLHDRIRRDQETQSGKTYA